MTTTHSAYDWLRERVRSDPAARPDRIETTRRRPDGPRHEREARAEIDRLLGSVEDLVTQPA